MSYVNIIILSLLIFNNCNQLIDNNIERLINLEKTINKRQGSVYADNSDIICIVLPEFLVYNKQRDNLEIAYIKILESIGSSRYTDVSFGPFQMDIDFIHENINKNNLEEISKSNIFKNIKKYSNLSKQWEILCLFVNNNKSLMKDSEWLMYLANKYNSGNPINTSNNFKKISCKKKSYYEWCLILRDELNP